MKILINGRFLTRKPTGVDRFAIEVVKELDKWLRTDEGFAANFEFEILVPKSTILDIEFKAISIRCCGIFKGTLWEQFDLPFCAGKRLLLNLCNSGPLLKRNQLVVIHDIATVRVPQSYSWRFRLWYRILIPTLYHRSLSICTVSNFSRTELIEEYGYRSHIVVVPESADHMADIVSSQSVLERFQLGKNTFILAVSSLAPHKNFDLIFKTIEGIDNFEYELVVVGSKNASVFKDESLPEFVKYVGYVSDEELKCLYQNALCFVFPSKYEGYGLPPIEAMSCGCPVLVANAASLPEVCGPAAVYFDPLHVEALASALGEVTSKSELRSKMIALSANHIKSLSWGNSVNTLIVEISRIENGKE